MCVCVCVCVCACTCKHQHVALMHACVWDPRLCEHAISHGCFHCTLNTPTHFTPPPHTPPRLTSPPHTPPHLTLPLTPLPTSPILLTPLPPPTGSYPFTQEDPFVIESAPHIYFTANQPSYQHKRVPGKWLLPSIPNNSSWKCSLI